VNQRVSGEKSSESENVVFFMEVKMAALECLHLMLDVPHHPLLPKKDGSSNMQNVFP
jgi:hypothetical protein